LEQLDGLGFEFGCVSPTWLLLHGHGFWRLVVQKSSSPQKAESRVGVEEVDEHPTSKTERRGMNHQGAKTPYGTWFGQVFFNLDRIQDGFRRQSNTACTITVPPSTV
jgi:hypothetical protein